MISTSLWGLFPGVFSAFAAFLAYNYFFLLPYHTFVVHETQDIIALVIFLVVAVFISQLIGRARAGLASAVARASETTRLYELSLDLAGASSMDEIAEVLARKTTETVKATHLEISILPIHGEASFRLAAPRAEFVSTNPDAVIPWKPCVSGGSSGWMAPWHPMKSALRTFAAQAALAWNGQPWRKRDRTRSWKVTG
jgi:K+-sensing histidine kinase KdpD